MILAVDLGEKTTGLAISSGLIAQPYKTITHNTLIEAVNKISIISEEESIDTIVLGFVEGKIKSYFEKCADLLKIRNPKIKIELIDETLSTRQAADTMINLNIPRGKRKEKEHEVAAAIILQSYLSKGE